MTLHAHHRIESSLAEGLQADFTLDVVGNITAIAGAGGAPINGYSYDDLYRLTSESAPALSPAATPNSPICGQVKIPQRSARDGWMVTRPPDGSQRGRPLP